MPTAFVEADTDSRDPVALAEAVAEKPGRDFGLLRIENMDKIIYQNPSMVGNL